ncbi:Zinc finger protein [Pseudocercospora fuligena]|uniref:Zinc finger protein n=1 Tax=Pseudocercospora fuligena TaxID=685502 RepID=A0A8H6RUE7_9PEZI|nr:Zinc finger protein [Pseudocercospora fuligena]
MGSHFNAAVAHAQFAQMVGLKVAVLTPTCAETHRQTSSPMSGTNRGSLSPRPLVQSRQQSYQQPRSHPSQASSMDAYFSPFDAPYAGYQDQSASSTAHSVTNDTSVITPMVYERSATPNSFQESTTDSRQSFLSKMAHRIERSLSPHTSNQHLPSSQYPAYSDAPLVPAAPTFAPQFPQPIQYPSQPIPIDHQPEPSMDRNLEQFFPELNTPLQQPQMPRSVPLPHSTSFHATPSMLSTSDPMHISSEIVHNPNYQPGINQGPSTGTMLGWIGRAPTIGQRTSMPTLKVDTNHLAPPNLSPLHRSPSSASSAGSSSKSPRRARAEMLFGDMHCHYCNAAFTTQGDLTHHLRSHQPYLSRNHVCQMCNKRFQYRKDLMRHLPRHDPNRPKFYCPFNGCKYNTKGFGRQDHLDRHVNTQHNRVDSPHDSRSRNNSSLS